MLTTELLAFADSVDRQAVLADRRFLVALLLGMTTFQFLKSVRVLASDWLVPSSNLLDRRGKFPVLVLPSMLQTFSHWPFGGGWREAGNCL
jgi:hypothetical protein